MLWIKAFHIIGVVTWFAALFYLPRLFVYHSMTEDATGRARFRQMERRLYRAIMMPSFIIATGFGAWLAILSWEVYLREIWFLIKIFLVVLLIIYHFYCGHLCEIFARDANTRTAKFYRWFNEFPSVILILVVILAVVKPF